MIIFFLKYFFLKNQNFKFWIYKCHLKGLELQLRFFTNKLNRICIIFLSATNWRGVTRNNGLRTTRRPGLGTSHHGPVRGPRIKRHWGPSQCSKEVSVDQIWSIKTHCLCIGLANFEPLRVLNLWLRAFREKLVGSNSVLYQWFITFQRDWMALNMY